MKRNLKSFLFFCFIAFSSTAFCQQKCATKNRDLTTILEKQNIVASYFSANFAATPAYCLNFQNNGKATVTFSFILKDKTGEIISKQSLTLAPGQVVNGVDDKSFDKSMVIHPTDKQIFSDFTIELIF